MVSYDENWMFIVMLASNSQLDLIVKKQAQVL